MDEYVLCDLIMPENAHEPGSTVYEVDLPLAQSTPVKRKPTWSALEQNALIEAVTVKERKLFGKFKGPGRGKMEREAAWDEVAKAINQIGVYPRTGKEAAKQYANLKSRGIQSISNSVAKEKISQFKRPKTGGGPKPPSPTPVEQTLLDSLEGRPSLQGLSEGFDTGDMETECEQSHTVTQPATTSDDHAVTRSHSQGRSTKEKSLLSLQKEILLLEKKKMEKEIEVLDLQKEKLRDEISYLKMKKEKLMN